MADHNSLIASKLTMQLNCLTSLVEILDDELTAIASRRGEGLKEIAQQKLAFLSKIQILDKELSTLLASNDSRSEEVSDLISAVRKHLETCKKKNDVNAHAAHQAQLSVKQLKDILIGAPTSMTYDQGGSVVHGNSKLVHNLKA
ncbi:flagellar biogenesis protein [Pseudoalteromonas sp. A601]|uniref:flagellar protein FlgN n=1 Tax=Pseudoalteromonas sp. A601 TaxID=1967839 RepID=UPI000B3D39D3|nr:flagellar protein FlgN [Pseudoalteromonas sp. A601]OUS74707.1 flagellar biogenesis protein [Pseudoalteromonas sp. A601]